MTCVLYGSDLISLLYLIGGRKAHALNCVQVLAEGSSIHVLAVCKCIWADSSQWVRTPPGLGTCSSDVCNNTCMHTYASFADALHFLSRDTLIRSIGWSAAKNCGGCHAPSTHKVPSAQPRRQDDVARRVDDSLQERPPLRNGLGWYEARLPLHAWPWKSWLRLWCTKSACKYQCHDSATTL